MADMVIHYPDEILSAPGKSRTEIEDEMRFKFAALMFEDGDFSLGQAANSAGMTRLEFMDALGRARIPVINFDDKEIEAELGAIRANNRRG